jgi:hypothetical protein
MALPRRAITPPGAQRSTANPELVAIVDADHLLPPGRLCRLRDGRRRQLAQRGHRDLPTSSLAAFGVFFSEEQPARGITLVPRDATPYEGASTTVHERPSPSSAIARAPTGSSKSLECLASTATVTTSHLEDSGLSRRPFEVALGRERDAAPSPSTSLWSEGRRRPWRPDARAVVGPLHGGPRQGLAPC